MQARLASPPPQWLPANIGMYRGLLGWIEQSDKIALFNEFDGELCGGNCVIRSRTFKELGGFNTLLGRSSTNLMGGEDGEFHRRLKAGGKKGIYDPEMIIYHYIPSERMTVGYHVRWAFWSGASNGLRIKKSIDAREQTAYLIGIPRYWLAKGAKGVLSFMAQTISFNLTKNPKGIIGALDAAYLCGLIFGRHLMKCQK